jgi:hypothetical protein
MGVLQGMCGKGVMYHWQGAYSESRWARATFGGHEAEAEEWGGEANLQEAWIHGRAGFWRDEVGWQKTIDELARLGEGAGGVFSNVPGAQCEEDREESAGGHSQFAREV